MSQEETDEKHELPVRIEKVSSTNVNQEEGSDDDEQSEKYEPKSSSEGSVGEEVHEEVSDEEYAEDEQPEADFSENQDDTLMEKLFPKPAVVENPLDKLDDHQLVNAVALLETELRHCQLENVIFSYYLEQYDPSLLEGFQPLLSYIKGEGPPPVELITELTSRRSTRLDTASLSSILETRGPKINLSHKIDMVTKVTEEIQAKLEIFLKKCHKTRTKLKSELEEFNIREGDIREARDIFEFNVVTQGVEKLTQRIPAEKFIRYMEDWLKSATLNIEKLRLRTASLKVHYKKVSQTLIQRQELGENVHGVDFDQLEIENKHFLQKIEQKNIHSIELKKMNGGANLVLSRNKKYLQRQTKEFNDLKDKLVEHQKLVEDIEKECEVVEKEAEKASERLEYIRELNKSYTVPEVMKYISIKTELNDYRNEVKVWYRRKKIQDITLNACIRHMKNITGCSTVNKSWFVDPSSDEVSFTGFIDDKEQLETNIAQ